MKLAVLLLPVGLMAQAPDQAVRDRLKTLSQVPAHSITMDVKAQFDVRDVFSKAHVHSDANANLRITQKGNTATAEGNLQIKPITWTRPIAINPGEENPSEPSHLNAWLHPHRLDTLLWPAQSLLGIIAGATLKESKALVFEGEFAKGTYTDLKPQCPSNMTTMLLIERQP